MYNLAEEQTAARTWQDLKLFTDKQISRMAEVQFTADVCTAILEGIRELRRLRQNFKQLDDVFSSRSRVEAGFRQTMEYCHSLLPDAIAATRFKNRSWSYSLIVAAADCLVGIPNGFGPVKIIDPQDVTRRMIELDAAVKPAEPAMEVAALKDALARRTGDRQPRMLRHEHLVTLLSQPDDWKPGNRIQQYMAGLGLVGRVCAATALQLPSFAYCASFRRNCRRMLAKHRHILPSQNLKDVRVVHAKPLHNGRCHRPERMHIFEVDSGRGA